MTERNVNRGDFVQPAGATTAKPLLTVARRISSAFSSKSRKWTPLGSKRGGPDTSKSRRFPIGSWKEKWRGLVGPWAQSDAAHRAGFAQSRRRARPGMYATADLILQERRDACVLPLTAVASEGQRTFCWIARDGRATRTPIVLGLRVGKDVEVVSGLKSDELVVQSQLGSLREGQAIEAAK